MVRVSSLGFWTVALLAIAVSLTSMRLLTFNPDFLAEEIRPNLLDHPVPFYLHTTLAPIALLIGVGQFLPRTRSGPYHRWAGRLYVGCCLVAGVAGFIVAFTTEGGPAAAAGFAILALLWFGATLRAYLLARGRRFAQHRRWMLRSYALTCAAITLRLVLPLGLAAGLSFHDSYLIAAWACWIINLLVVELVLLPRLRPTDARPRSAPA